jgi:meiotically up-regulated gene 157 (Mug157) protein
MEQVMKRKISTNLRTILGPYTYQRQGEPPDPRGRQAKPNGLIYSFFRPSDDPQLYPYLIPSQFFAYHTLKNLFKLLKNLSWVDDFRTDIVSLTTDLYNILFNDNIKNNQQSLITFQHEKYGFIYSYEINGIGGQNLMDDSNIPSLLSLPYLCPDEIPLNDPIYQNTRKFVLSGDNPWFFTGHFLEGIGGPHVGRGMVWPLAIIMRGLTTNDDDEIRSCLKMLQTSHANTGLMHESINVDDPNKYTRPWFAWANSLFGEFIWKLYREKRYLLNEIHHQEAE